MLSQNMIKPHEEVVESAFFGTGVQLRKNLLTCREKMVETMEMALFYLFS